MSEHDIKFEPLPHGFYPPKYDPENDKLFKPDETVFVLGERRSGKTTVVTELTLRRRRLFPKVFVFTRTKHNNYWQQYVPERKIFARLDEEALEAIIHANTERYTEWKLIKHRTGKTKGNPLILLIFEDLVTQNELRQSPSIKTACLNGRHHGLATYTLAQDYCGMTPAERDNMDRWIIFRSDSDRVLSMIRQSFGPQVLDCAKRVWNDGRMIIIHKDKRVPLTDRIFWYESDMDYIKSATHRHLHLGNERWWSGESAEHQKSEFPCVDLPSVATLEGKFNEPVSWEEENESGVGVVEPADDEQKQQDEPVVEVAKPDF